MYKISKHEIKVFIFLSMQRIITLRGKRDILLVL